MSKFDIPGLEGEWVWDEGDPEELFFLEEEIASKFDIEIVLLISRWYVWNSV